MIYIDNLKGCKREFDFVWVKDEIPVFVKVRLIRIFGNEISDDRLKIWMSKCIGF